MLREKFLIARTLLLYTELSIADIAVRAGYAGGRSFSTLFKVRTGMKPRTYRNLVPHQIEDPIPLKEALEILLLHTGYSPREIAKRLGQPITGYKGAYFTNKIGITAKRYRENNGWNVNNFPELAREQAAAVFKQNAMTKAKDFLAHKRAKSIEEIIVACGYASGDRFRRDFKKVSGGITPKKFRATAPKYEHDERIDRAIKILVEEPDLHIPDVVAKAGLRDYYEFRAACRERFDRSPAECRKYILSNPDVGQELGLSR